MKPLWDDWRLAWKITREERPADPGRGRRRGVWLCGFGVWLAAGSILGQLGVNSIVCALLGFAYGLWLTRFSRRMSE